jgi:hemoglobin/transferrin/lactoferrin receptor protein
MGRTTHWRLSLLATAAIITYAEPALGQEQPEQQSAQEAETDGGLLDEITITVSKVAEKVIDALASVSVTSRTEIRTQQPQRIGTVISQTPGVWTEENPDDPATAINVRGLQDFGRVAVTIDGARQNFQRSGHNADGAFYLDTAFIRSIDITRGPVANVYGSGAIGGVVSFETVDPADILRPGEQIAGELTGRTLFQSQEGYNGSFIGAIRPVDQFQILLGGALKDLDDYKDGSNNLVPDSGHDVESYIGKVVFEPREGHRLELTGQAQGFDFTGGAGTATSPRRTSDVDTENYTAQYGYRSNDTALVDVRASAYFTSTDAFQKRISGTPAQQQQTRDFSIETTGFDANNTSRFDIGDVRLAVTYGADLFHDKVKVVDDFGTADLFTPTGKRTVYGGFIQSHMQWQMFDLIAAGRYDAYDLEGGEAELDGERLSPKVTLGVTPFRGFQVYGTYAEGYRSPAITETLIGGFHPPPANFEFLPNPNLKPEVGKTLEAGVNIKYDDVLIEGDTLRAKSAIYQNDVSDFIEGIFDPIANTYQYVNVADAQLWGIEGELVYDAGAWFATAAGSMNRGDNETTDEPLQSVYPDKLILGAGVRLLENDLTLGARLTLVAEQDRLPAAAVALASESYELIDIYAAYDLYDFAQIYASIDNVGDVTYIRYRDGDESPGLVAKVGFTTRFGQ